MNKLILKVVVRVAIVLLLVYLLMYTGGADIKYIYVDF